jgi:predicted peptidase
LQLFSPIKFLLQTAKHFISWRMVMKHKALVAIALIFMITAACQPAATPTPQPALQTEVQLQASFPIPHALQEGAPASEMNYLIYFPKGYDQDAEELWPTILFLHGAGGEDNDSAFVMSYGLPEVLHKGEQPADFPFIVVSPQAFPNTSWWMGNTLEVLIALLDEAISLYRVDPSRVYLTGLSMGGYGSWHLASAYPDRFAAIVSVAGSGFGNENPDITKLCMVRRI